MHAVIRWFRTPLPLKFWLLAAAAALVVLLEIGAVWSVVRAAVEVWRFPYPRPFPWLTTLVAGAYTAGLFALGVVLVRRAIRAYPHRS